MTPEQQEEAIGALHDKVFDPDIDASTADSVAFDRWGEGDFLQLTYELPPEGSDESAWYVEDEAGDIKGEGDTATAALDSMERYEQTGRYHE